MLFNSWHFLLFFPVVTAGFFILPHRFRVWWLLVASCYFYAAYIPKYLLILVAIIVIDFSAAFFIANASGSKRKLYLTISIVANIGLLAIFKYYNFAATNINELSSFLNWHYGLPLLSAALPLGLSFHTFQALSYTIEVYRGHQKPERNLGVYGLYVLYYPQLVAGPIERPGDMLPQFHEKRYFDPERVKRGLVRMLGGFFKKIVIADRAAVLVDQVYNASTDQSGWSYLVATILFAFQIYGDFSGYTDIALGASEVLGFRLMENFNRPYAATSVSEFWRRWHISLSSWFRDYVYIPLGGSKVSRLKHYRNLMLVFMLSGLWHGAGWTYVAWGLLHGSYLVCAEVTKKWRLKVVEQIGLSKIPATHQIIKIVSTFFLVLVTWIFFRSQNIAQAIHILKTIVRDVFSFTPNVFSIPIISENKSRFFLTAFAILALLITEKWGRESVRNRIIHLPVYFRYAMYTTVLWIIVFFGAFGSKQFIYFVF